MSLDNFDFKQTIFLGERVSKMHPYFRDISKLGFEEAEQYSILRFIRWLNKNGDASLEDVLERALEYIGMAKFLRNTKEITRLSLILGDTRKKVSAKDW